MIDQAIRSTGVGASEVAAIMGFDPRRDALSVWAEKTGKVPPAEPTDRMIFGKLIEQSIARIYAQLSGNVVIWNDVTLANAQRPWQVSSPDAITLDAGKTFLQSGLHTIDGGAPKISRELWARIVECKNVAYDPLEEWGEPGSDVVPDKFALQIHWQMDCMDLKEADLPALFGGNKLPIYRIHYSPKIAENMREEVEHFWNYNVLGDHQPAPGATDGSARALRVLFPKNTEPLRMATSDEMQSIHDLREAKTKAVQALLELKEAAHGVEALIGDSDGIKFGGEKIHRITWKRSKDTRGTDWEAIARRLTQNQPLLDSLIAQHEIITREGSRRLVLPRAWTKGTEEFIDGE